MRNRNRKGQFTRAEDTAFRDHYLRAFGFLFLVGHTLALLFGRPVVHYQALSPSDIAPSETEQVKRIEHLIEPSIELIAEKDFMSHSEAERKEKVAEYLAVLNAPDIDTFLRIGKAESSYRSDALPPVEVRHCKRSNNTYYVVELMNGRQASCRDGDIQVHAEKSVGIFQILPSTAKRVCGSVDLFDWRTNIECAVKIQARSGFNQWSTY